MAKYNVTVHRVVEHETIYQIEADSDEEAEEFAIEGYYDEIISDFEEGEMEDPNIIDIKEIIK